MTTAADISTTSGDPQEQLRRARGRFAAMSGTYGLGVFNDNFFKQAACLLAVYLGWPTFQMYVVVLFTLPWLLFPAWAGWAADRFAKRHVVIFAKAIELAAMICGGVGIITVNWTLILVMMFTMALQSTIFSPALNGSIPELYPAEYVVRANSRLKSLVLMSNLVGIILAGVLLDFKQIVWGVELGRLLVGLGVIAIALIGVAMSLGVDHHPPADPKAKFPWAGPVSTFRELKSMRRDRLLWVVLLTDAFVWFIAAVQILVINEMGKSRFGLSEKETSYILAAELLGVGVGAFLAARLARGRRWYRILPTGLVILGLLLVGIAAGTLLPHWIQYWFVTSSLVLAGVAGGVLLIPCEAFFQIRPAPEKKGAVIATANFAGFLGMSISGLFYGGLLALNMAPLHRLGVLGATAVLTAIWLQRALRKIKS
jgi:acyl-[acyl-carrier-protein]-phospholipid O-acyltransferase/long-chain-fatty-acid--[acyl-carrier-protein] ligase